MESMTKERLVQYMDLIQERKELRNRVDKIQQQIEDIEAEGPVVDKVVGGLGGIQSFRIEGFPYPEYSRKKTLLRVRQANLQELEERITEDLIAIEYFIASIQDSHIRRIISMRAVDGLTWNEVADRMGGGNSEDSVRMAFNRYMKS